MGRTAIKHLKNFRQPIITASDSEGSSSKTAAPANQDHEASKKLTVPNRIKYKTIWNREPVSLLLIKLITLLCETENSLKEVIARIPTGKIPIFKKDINDLENIIY